MKMALKGIRWENVELILLTEACVMLRAAY